MAAVRLQPDRLRLAVARVLAFLLLWMATGGVLTHSDPLTWGRSASSRTTIRQAAAPASPADVCAACEWTQALQTGSAVVVQVISPASLPRARTAVAPAPLPTRVPDRPSARAPPLLP